MSASRATRRGRRGKPAPILSERDHEAYPHRANGPAMAGVLAAAIGTFVLGVLTTLNEVSVGLHDWLQFNDPVGPLSGKTTLAVAAWAVSWLVFGLIWRNRDISVRTVVIVSAVLIGLGVLGTYPTFFEKFAAE